MDQVIAPCFLCKGGKMLCGRRSCPLIQKNEVLKKFSRLIDSNIIDGNSPPGVFVGRIGYPKVFAGPMIPPLKGDTRILDFPEYWMGKTIDNLLEFRYALVRAKKRINVEKPQDSQFLLQLQELAMANKSVEAEALFNKKPNTNLIVSALSAPYGPSASLINLKMGNVNGDNRIEKAFYDIDLKASEAIYQLYLTGVPITQIQKCLSVGMFGLKDGRKLVPTRWSITTVDDTISKNLTKKMKHYPTIDDFRVYNFNYLDNRYVVLLFPFNWEFEWIEAWFPSTLWNQNGKIPQIIGDYEGYRGRTTYAKVGGCYYSAKLAISEALVRERKQSSALVLREIHPGYTLPVGVWHVRESIRVTMKKKPVIFDNHSDAIKYAMKILTIPWTEWLKESELLKKIIYQNRLEIFLQNS